MEALLRLERARVRHGLGTSEPPWGSAHSAPPRMWDAIASVASRLRDPSLLIHAYDRAIERVTTYPGPTKVAELRFAKARAILLTGDRVAARALYAEALEACNELPPEWVDALLDRAAADLAAAAGKAPRRAIRELT